MLIVFFYINLSSTKVLDEILLINIYRKGIKMGKKHIKTNQIICLIIIVIIINIVVIYFLRSNYNTGNIIKIAVEKNILETSNKMIKTIEIAKVNNMQEVSDRLNKLEAEILEYIESNNISEDEISIVIQDLYSLEKIELNEDQNFTAASIYKLPLAIIYYDLINSGEIDIDDKYQLLSSHLEGGGVLTSNYSIGSYIPLEYILEVMIEYSDNEAGHILFENLGGWTEFKEKSLEYGYIENISEYLTENVITANYTSEILEYIYSNQEQYEILIESMKQASPNQYLDIDVTVDIAQKYGWYGEALNIVGIVYADNPYNISIFTELSYEEGCRAIDDINKICLNSFQN